MRPAMAEDTHNQDSRRSTIAIIKSPHQIRRLDLVRAVEGAS